MAKQIHRMSQQGLNRIGSTISRVLKDNVKRNQMQSLDQQVNQITNKLDQLEISNLQRLHIAEKYPIIKQFLNLVQQENANHPKSDLQSKCRYRANVMPFANKSQGLYKELYNISIDRYPQINEVNDYLGVIGSLLIDDDKLTPVLKQLDTIKAVQYLLIIATTHTDVQTLVRAFWALSNFATIKRYLTEDYVMSPILMQRVIELYQPILATKPTSDHVRIANTDLDTYIQLKHQIAWYICNMINTLSITAFQSLIKQYPQLLHIVYNASLEQLFGISIWPIENEIQINTMQEETKAQESVTNAVVYERSDTVLKHIAFGIFRKFQRIITYPDEGQLRL